VILFPKVTTGTQLVDFWKLRFDTVFSELLLSKHYSKRTPFRNLRHRTSKILSFYCKHEGVFFLLFCPWELLPESAAVCVPETWWRTFSPWTELSYETVDFGCSSLS